MEEQNGVSRRDKEDTDALLLTRAGFVKSRTNIYLALGLGTGRDLASSESLLCGGSRPRPLTIVVKNLRGLLQYWCHSLKSFAGRSLLVVCFARFARHQGNVRRGMGASVRQWRCKVWWYSCEDLLIKLGLILG